MTPLHGETFFQNVVFRQRDGVLFFWQPFCPDTGCRWLSYNSSMRSFDKAQDWKLYPVAEEQRSEALGLIQECWRRLKSGGRPKIRWFEGLVSDVALVRATGRHLFWQHKDRERFVRSCRRSFRDLGIKNFVFQFEDNSNWWSSPKRIPQEQADRLPKRYWSRRQKGWEHVAGTCDGTEGWHVTVEKIGILYRVMVGGFSGPGLYDGEYSHIQYQGGKRGAMINSRFG